MDRLACVDAPAFPLQLLLREHPDWKDYPVAVVAEDKPQAPLLWVNEHARRLRVLPGQRYAAALSIAADLRAAPVSKAGIESGVAWLTGRLRRYTPDVEPAQDEPGVFWLNASGLGRLYTSLEAWADAVRLNLQRAGFLASVVVGFTRFGTYAVAKSVRGGKVFRDPQEETAAAGKVSLERLAIDPELRDLLDKLGVRTVGEILNLPAEGLRKRFGAEAYDWHRLAAGDLWTPLQPQAAVEPIERREELEAPESDSERLLFLIKRSLDSLLMEMASRGEALQELCLRLALDRAAERTEKIRPAAPTLDSAQILGLVRLRLESLDLKAGVVELKLIGGGIRVAPQQSSLFAEKPRRDLEAAGRALARLRAELGDDAVVRARRLEGHLPRASFRWEPLERIPPPSRRPTTTARSLVRRIYSNPIPLPPRSRHEPDGWLLRGLEHGPVQQFVGPYIVSGGWWGGGVHRDYYFVLMKHGDVYWAFYDRRRRRWFLEGRVE